MEIKTFYNDKSNIFPFLLCAIDASLIPIKHSAKYKWANGTLICLSSPWLYQWHHWRILSIGIAWVNARYQYCKTGTRLQRNSPQTERKRKTKKFNGKCRGYKNTRIKENKRDEKVKSLLRYFALRSVTRVPVGDERIDNKRKLHPTYALISKVDFY